MRRVAIVMTFVILTAALLVIPAMLEFGSPKMSDMDNYFLANGQAQAATNNICTSVVFDYRGFDTLGESTVLFTAVVGVGLMFRHFFREEEHEDE
jgi:multisubunit Na+/H+ antiporter MnhB subunit